MSIIEQLEQHVTPAVLGDNSSVAHICLLEQFYAILVARLALPEVYSQLLRSDQVVVADSVPETPLFEQLWQAPNMRQTLVQELAATHHIDELATVQLLINAAPLAYRELKVLANGQFLPAFLQREQSALRQYLPTWSAPFITASQSIHQPSGAPSVRADATIAAVPDMPKDKVSASDTTAITPSTAAAIENSSVHPNTSANLSKHRNSNLNNLTDVMHTSPTDHHLAENGSMKREKVRTRNQRNDLLVRVFLLILAVVAIGFAAWALLIKPNGATTVEPVATAPVVVPPTIEPAAQFLTPVELIVGVDDSGSLYTCSATVGDEALQSILQQALNTSFGEQASICELTIQVGVASSMNSIPAEVLPNILTMLRSTPFARLHLQNERVTLEAPDNMLLQRLVTDIRTLAPALMIDSVAPLPLPNNSNGVGDMTAMNGQNPQFESDASAANNAYNSNSNSNSNVNGNNFADNANNNGAGEYQATDDDTGDSMMPAPARNTPVRSNNGNLTNVPSNLPNNSNSRALTNNTNSRPSGPISLSEVDNMASNVIVAEPAQVRN
ncbi:hypothetical protein [Psychrobacter sp. K31L]|uniref:hypothetical protein n=1 Tax=Psychrobacter sp. K31L TaxID=2820758 RepID=UPI001B31D785|nr:hypothetical protein [Psychrobacter sp. K31L]MBP3946473.1 hypothetical protein [Psychrobacter sp. K31L]